MFAPIVTEDEEEALFSEWFDLVNEKNTLVQQENTLKLKEEARKLQELGQYIDSSLRKAFEKEGLVASFSLFTVCSLGLNSAIFPNR